MIKGTHTIAQFKILDFIQRNFEAGSIKTELVGADKVKITDTNGKSITLSINVQYQVFDYDTKEILGE